ncbi:MAG: porin family protein [Bacteroidales bacterium]|nr:porin family protein [Bacteroidales bacterium]MCF8333368.1 porin family protein [Bacteroidales bacterium]
MRKITGTLLLIIISTLVLAQNEKQDVLHLENGSIIKGDIIEVIPGEQVKIESSGNILVYEMTKVKKMVKTEKAKKEKEKKEEKENVSKDDEESFSGSGFIGISFASSYPLDDFADDSPDNPKAGYASNGLTINILNLGYQFHPNLGIGFKWFGASHFNEEREDKEDMWSTGGLLIGPLMVMPLRDIMSLELRPMIGTGGVILDKEGEDDIEGYGTSYHLGANLRFDIHENWRINAGINYTSFDPEFEENTDRELKVNTLELNTGIGYIFE